MTQPAKAQEPSMEEILASIRRIIADDEPAKPAEAARPERPRAEAARPEPARSEPSRPEPVQHDPVRPSPPRAAPARAEPPRPEAVRPAAAQPAAPARNPNKVDAMTANAAPSQDTSGQVDVLELTESMAAPEPAPKPAAPASRFQTIGPEPDVVFADASSEPREEPRHAQTTPPPSFDTGGLISNATQSAVDSAFNTLAQTVLVQNARTLEDLVREMLRPMLKTWLDDNLPGLVERLVRAEIERVSRSRS